MTAAPFAVGIPTWGRGDRIVETLKRVAACNPSPSEVIVHVDGGDVELARKIETAFPMAKLLVGEPVRIGPGGGRNKCIEAATQPFFVSFDDDSYPVDADFFAEVVRLFERHSDAAVLGAQIWHRGGKEIPRSDAICIRPIFTGCGYAMRVAAYKQIRGYLPRPDAYGMEESDLSIQLFAKNWKIFDACRLRVFHDTDLSHHENPRITAETIANAGLFAFLHYPVAGWPWGILQIGNAIWYALKVGRVRGILTGLFRIPATCYNFRWARKPLPLPMLIRYLRFRRSQ